MSILCKRMLAKAATSPPQSRVLACDDATQRSHRFHQPIVARWRSLCFWGLAISINPSLVLAGLVHVEELVPGVCAAGFSARSGSANCGWIKLENSTLMVDLPHEIGMLEFLNEINDRTGKPVRSCILTRPISENDSRLSALVKAGVRILPFPAERAEIGNATTAVEVIPYGSATGSAGAAVYLPRQQVLFAGPIAVNGPRIKLPGSDTEEWIRALVGLEKLSVVRVVPGFGSWGSGAILRRQRLFLSELRRQIAYKISQAVAVEKLEKEIVIPAAFSVWTPYDTPVSEDIRHIYRELTVPHAPYKGRPPAKKGLHALVLVGDRFHEPEHIEAGLGPVFEATGVTPHFLYDVSGLNAENLSHVQLLVIQRDGYVWPEGKGVSWMTPAQERAVVDFVEHGGAFLNLHNSMGLYPDNGPYLALVGGRYIGHGPLERFRTEVVDSTHPITKGVTQFFTADEQHTPPYDTNRVHLLLRNRSDDGKVVAAAGWAYEPGRGRLCHLANGHTYEALIHPMYQRLMRNAIQWCLRRE